MTDTNNQDVDKLDAALYSGLIELLKTDTEPFRIVQNSGKYRGLNAWRRLNKKFDPNNEFTNIAMTRKLLNPHKCNLESLIGGMELW